MARRVEGIVLIALATAVVAAGLAWACTPSADIVVSPSEGRSGDAASVSGAQFRDGPVTLHWDSAGGPVIGSGTGPNFSTGITIPDSAPGTHYVVATQEGGGTDTAAYRVLAAPEPQPSPTTPGASNAPAAPQPATGGSGGGERGKSVSGGGSVTQSPQAGTPAPPVGLPETAQVASRAEANARGANARGAEGSARSAVADLWAAFDRPPNAAGSGLAGPASGGGGGSSLLPAGMAMLTVGLLALVGGWGVAAARRNRARTG